jgi:hypothetical protein
MIFIQGERIYFLDIWDYGVMLKSAINPKAYPRGVWPKYKIPGIIIGKTKQEMPQIIYLYTWNGPKII